MPSPTSVVEAIGNTPLIRLNRASDATGCEIWGKAEFMNPGQSVKDRAALFIIRDAERRGLLRPGGLIVEGTAGNTGIGLAMVASALGYRCEIVIPRTQSQEKKDAIKLLGAEVGRGGRPALFQPRQLCPLFRALGRGAAAKRAQWRDLGQPVRQCRQPRRPMWRRPRRRSGPRPAAESTASSARSAAAAPWPAWPMACAPATPRSPSAWPTRWGAALYQLVRPRRA